MRTLFKNIRRSLVGSRSLRKYLLYTISEIVLVVVGILLALQINNWNENRKEDKTEEMYLMALEKEFQDNHELLIDFIILNKKLVEQAKEMLYYTHPESIEDLTEDKVNQMFSGLIGQSVEYEPSPGILEDLISSGNLNKLKNQNLRKLLSQWKSKFILVKRQENTVLEYRSNIKHLLIEEGDTRNPVASLIGIDETTFGTQNTALFKNKKLENNLSFFAIASMSLETEYYEALLSLINEILLTIQQQLY